MASRHNYGKKLKKTPVTLSGYYRFAHTAKTKIETLRDRSWQAPTPPEFDKWLEEKETFIHSDTPGFEHLAYLRHHGFPSPLLDWTASPYVAQFVAYNGCDPRRTDNVAIYCCSEYYEAGKIRSNDQPEIYKFGPYAKVHKRHVLQQSQYTICVEFDDNYKPIYANHEEVFKRNDKTQDRLWKFVFSISFKMEAIKKLNMMKCSLLSLLNAAISSSLIGSGRFSNKISEEILWPLTLLIYTVLSKYVVKTMLRQ